MASNGKPFSFDRASIEPAKKMSKFQTFSDVIVFLLVSAVYILQSFYYQLFGYPKKDLNGELALVTGGSGGLGRLLAMRLIRLGAKVILWDINQEGLDETVKMIESMGGFCKGYVVDISKKEEVYKAAEEIKNNIGDVTLLFNNAGVVSGRALLDTPDHMIERSFNVNVLAHFWTTKAFLPAMLEKNHGHIISIASLAGHVGISKLIDYCSTKFAAVGFDEALRMELEFLRADGVHTTVVCPYFIQATGMFDDVNSRWVPTLNSNDVADRVIEAVQKNDKYVIVPGYLRIMLAVKWIFPWGCVSGFLRRLVPDATPQHHVTCGSPNIKKTEEMGAHLNGCLDSNTLNNNTTTTTLTSDKANPLLVHRMTSVGERVL